MQVGEFSSGGILGVKYSTLPGIRDLHDFIFVRHSGSDVNLRVRAVCYTGTIEESNIHVKRGYELATSAIQIRAAAI